MNNTNDNMDFTQGSIFKKLIFFMGPILASLILQAMYGAVDLLVVGHFGTTAGLSGISTGSSVLNLVTFVVTSLAMGITVMISHSIGMGEREEVGSIIGAGIAMFAIIGIVFSVLMIVFAEPIAILMQAPEEAVDLTAQYIRICGAGFVFITAYNVIAAIFRGLGDSRSPFLFVLIACIVNIFGDLFLVAVLHMNVAGAAIATVAAQAVSVAISIVIIARRRLVSVHRRDIALNYQVKRILQIGAPLALQEILTQASFMALCAFVNRIGLDASSGYGVASKIVSFVMLIPSSLAQSMTSFVSQNVGAGKEDRTVRTMITGMGIGLGIGIPVYILIYFFGNYAAAVFTTDPTVIASAWSYLRGFAPEAIVTAILFGFMGYFNGHEMTWFFMIQGMVQTLLVRLPMAYYMSIQPEPSLAMIGLSAPCATLFGIVLNTFYFAHVRKRIKAAAAG